MLLTSFNVYFRSQTWSFHDLLFACFNLARFLFNRLYMKSQRTALTVESMSAIFGALRRRPLSDAYRQFTHGGNYWSDLYLLERWDQQIQPVVYRGEVYNGYELLRRVGNWCWLTKDPITRCISINPLVTL